MNHPIRRRSLLAAAAALTAATAPGWVLAQGKIELIYSDTVVESDPRAAILKDVFGKSLGADFNFQPYFGATLFK